MAIEVEKTPFEAIGELLNTPTRIIVLTGTIDEAFFKFVLPGSIFQDLYNLWVWASPLLKVGLNSLLIMCQPQSLF